MQFILFNIFQYGAFRSIPYHGGLTDDISQCRADHGGCQTISLRAGLTMEGIRRYLSGRGWSRRPFFGVMFIVKEAVIPTSTFHWNVKIHQRPDFARVAVRGASAKTIPWTFPRPWTKHFNDPTRLWQNDHRCVSKIPSNMVKWIYNTKV